MEDISISYQLVIKNQQKLTKLGPKNNPNFKYKYKSININININLNININPNSDR